MDEERNRVLVGLPDRLSRTQDALRDAERLIENIRLVYAHRSSVLKDEIILDSIGDLLGENSGA